MKLGTNKLKLDFLEFKRIFLDTTISTEKPTREIDANLSQNEI